MKLYEKIKDTESKLKKLNKQFNENLKLLRKIKIGQKVFLQGFNTFDFEYYPCIVKSKNEKNGTLKLYEYGIKRYHTVDVDEVKLHV